MDPIFCLVRHWDNFKETRPEYDEEELDKYLFHSESESPNYQWPLAQLVSVSSGLDAFICHADRDKIQSLLALEEISTETGYATAKNGFVPITRELL